MGLRRLDFPTSSPTKHPSPGSPAWIELLMSLESRYWLTKELFRPMQLRDKNTYSIKGCVNKGTLQRGQTKAHPAPIQGFLGLRSSARSEGLHGRPWGGCDEWSRLWVSSQVRTEGVARMALRGQQELKPFQCPELSGDHGWSASQGGGSGEEKSLAGLCCASFFTHFCYHPSLFSHFC